MPLSVATLFTRTLQTPATFSRSANTLSCLSARSPSSTSARVPFGISLNGQELTTDPFFFFFIGAGMATTPEPPPPPPFSEQEDVEEAFRYPTPGGTPGGDGYDATGLVARFVNRFSGNISGGALVRIWIDPQPPEATSLPTCRFGEAVVPATVQSSTTLVCITPNTTTAGPVTFGVSLNAQDYSEGGGQFCFVNVTGLLAEPTEGPVSGGTRILSRGHGLVPDGCHSDTAREPKRCRWFNPALNQRRTVAAAVDQGRGALVCYSPPNSMGWGAGDPLVLSVSLNAYDYLPATMYRYEPVPPLPALSPGNGPITGGTMLALFGASMRDVDGLACFFGGARSAAVWQSNSLVQCRTPDLHSVASSVALPPPDSVPEVIHLFDGMNRNSSDALAAAPLIDLLFNEHARAEAAAARTANLYWGHPPQPLTIGGALTLSGGIELLEGVARLSSPTRLPRGPGLLRLALPNCNAPLQTFALQVEVLFRSMAQTAANLVDEGLFEGGLAVEYGPDPDALEHLDGHSLADVCEDGTRRNQPWAAQGSASSAEEVTRGLNISLLASVRALRPSVRHNGNELLALGLVEALSADFGPPVDVWMGLHVTIAADLVTHEAYLNLSLAGTPLSPPLALNGWGPQTGWTLRLRAIGGRGVGVSVYRVRLLSGSTAALTPIGLKVVVGPLFVSPAAPFYFLVPPLVPWAGVAPTAGPVEGGTVVRVRVANYSSTVGTLPDASLALRCRFGNGLASVDEFTSPAVHWGETSGDGVSIRVGLECTAPSHLSAGPEMVRLRISTNAQQFIDAANFSFYARHAWGYATPRSGPTGGGALLTVRGWPMDSGMRSGGAYACRVGGVAVAGTYRLQPERIQCRTPALSVTGFTAVPVELSLNAQQFVPLNRTFFVFADPVDAVVALPASGPANGGSVVEVHVSGGGLGARHGAVTTEALDYRCAFGHFVRGLLDEMLVEGAAAVPATHVDDGRLRCVSPTAEVAGASDFLEPLRAAAGRSGRRHVNGAAITPAAAAPTIDAERPWRGSWPMPPSGGHDGGGENLVENLARLTGPNGECGSVLVAPSRSAASHARTEWIEHTMFVRSMMPTPSWSGGGRVASLGGFSWSYGPLRPGPHATVGAAGKGLGLIVRLAPQPDGRVLWEVLRAGELLYSKPLPISERDALVRGEWRRLWLRLDERGMNFQLGNSTLVAAADSGTSNSPHGLALHPKHLRAAPHWTFAWGACSVAPEQPEPGAWLLANVTMRSGARLRYSDEQLRVSLNGQQFLAWTNLTFRYYAAPRPVQITPNSVPRAGGTPLTIRGEGLAEASAFECEFADGGTADERLRTGAELLATSTINNNSTDGAGGAGTLRCPTPTALPRLGEWSLGIRVDRAGQNYGSHEDVAAVPSPLWVYPSLSTDATYAPASGPGAGGTLVRIELPRYNTSTIAFANNASDAGPLLETVAGLWPRHGAKCRFGAAYYDGAYGPTIVDASHDPAGAQGEAMLCASPALPGGEAPLQLALNGHDFEPVPALPFHIYGRPRLVESVPAGATPGTSIILVGENLGGDGLPGVNHTCRFGTRVVLGELLVEPRVVGNQWRTNTVRCVVPEMPLASSTAAGRYVRSVPLRISLNGQQYSPEPVRFSFPWLPGHANDALPAAGHWVSGVH